MAFDVVDDFESYPLGASPYENLYTLSPTRVTAERSRSGAQSLGNANLVNQDSPGGVLLGLATSPFVVTAWAYLTHDHRVDTDGPFFLGQTPDLLVLSTDSTIVHQVSFGDVDSIYVSPPPGCLGIKGGASGSENLATSPPLSASGWYQFGVALNEARECHSWVKDSGGAVLIENLIAVTWSSATDFYVTLDIPAMCWWDDIGEVAPPEIDDSGPYPRAYFS